MGDICVPLSGSVGCEPFSPYSANGLTADILNGNSNYVNYDSPYNYTGGFVEIGLRLFDDSSSVPEPGSVFLLGSGVLGLAGVLRRKMNPRPGS